MDNCLICQDPIQILFYAYCQDKHPNPIHKDCQIKANLCSFCQSPIVAVIRYSENFQSDQAWNRFKQLFTKKKASARYHSLMSEAVNRGIAHISFSFHDYIIDDQIAFQKLQKELDL